MLAVLEVAIVNDEDARLVSVFHAWIILVIPSDISIFEI